MYSVFKKRGITFENDVYGKIDRKIQKIIQKCRKRNLFHMRKTIMKNIKIRKND